MKYSLEHGNNNYRFFFVHITSLVVALDPWCVPNRAAGVLSSGVAAAIFFSGSLCWKGGCMRVYLLQL